jgi:hypothetical protein
VIFVFNLKVHVAAMSVGNNFAQNVIKRGGVVSQGVVTVPTKLFGFVAKTVYLQRTCVNFLQGILNNLPEKDILTSDIHMIILGVSIVIEKFPVLVSLISKIMIKCVKKNFGNKNNWNEMINVISTPDIYKAVLRETFSDDMYTFNRLYVVTSFTEQVCRKYPEISLEVQNIFLDFIRCIE